MKKYEGLYIGQIIDRITAIEELVKDSNNKIENESVYLNLQTITDAILELSSDTKNRYPHIPWEDIVNSFNILFNVYNYDYEYGGDDNDYYNSINTESILSAIKKELPALKAAVLLEMNKLISHNS